MKKHQEILPKLEGHGGCFAAGTFVLTPEGKKPVSVVMPGDIVLAFDDRGNIFEKKVCRVFSHERQEVFCYHFWGGRHLTATPNHLVLNQYNAFVCIDSLTQEDGIIDKKGHVRPFLYKTVCERQTVYNLLVEDLHTFIANDLCVHNGGLDLSVLPPLAGSGGGGKGGGGSSFREDPNTLQASTTARILEVLSCGPIEGLVDGAKSVYLDQTPIMNKDGSLNFQGVDFEFRNGEQDQSVIKGFESVRTEYSVGVEITQKNPVVRKIKLTSETAIIIRLNFPKGLSWNNTAANALVKDSVAFTIEFSYDGGPYKMAAKNLVIDGKTTSPYEQAFYFELEKAGEVDIRITRLTADSDEATRYNDSAWSGYTLVSGYALNYPGMALMGYVVNSEGFGSSIPSRICHVRGLIVDVPSNYDPEKRTYSGIWDGTFKKAYTNNPAWFLWWLLNDEHNGLGGLVPDWALAFTKTDLYEIAKYCDGLVPDGYGGLEPRFTFNAQIVQAQNALEFLRLICSTCLLQVYWSNQGISFSQERKKEVSRVFSKANVIDGMFQYDQVDLASRHSVFAVSYNDMTNFGKAETEVVEDRELIGKIGVKKHAVSLVGCTSRGQARRIAKHLLFLEKLSDFMISFKIGLAECDIVPGEIVGVFDRDFMGADLAGRIKEYRDNVLVLDREADFSDGSDYYVYLTLADGLPQKIAVENPRKKTDTITLLEKPKTAPVKAAVFGLFSAKINPQECMVLGIADNGDNTFTVTVMQYDSRIFDMVENNLFLPKPPTSVLPTGPLPAPGDFSVQEYIYAESSAIKAGAIFSWKKPDDVRISFFEIWMQTPISNGFEKYGMVSAASIDIKDVIKGEYIFRIRSISGIGAKSVWAEYKVYLYGLDQPLPDVTGFTTMFKAGRLYLTWNEVDDLRSFKYELRMGESWEEGFTVAKTALTEYPVISDGTYFIKAVFQKGESQNPAVLEVEGAGSLQQNVIAVIDEAKDGWDGDKEYFTVLENRLFLMSGADFYGIADLYAEENVYMAGYTGEEAVYGLLPEKDVLLSSNHVCNIVFKIKAYAVNKNADFYSIDDIYSAEDIYGLVDRGWNVQIEMQKRKDSVWEENWYLFTPGEYLGDGFRFRLRVKGAPDTYVFVEEFQVSVDVPDRREHYKNIFVPADGLAFSFDRPFNAPPTIVATILQASGREDVIIEDELVTKEGFFVRVADKEGLPVEKYVNFLCEGY